MRNPETQFLLGDNREQLAALPAGYFHCCVTSPPYFNLRDYGRGGKWEGGDAGCDHKSDTKHQKEGASSARAGRANGEAIRNETFADTCGKCGAVRVDRQIGREKTPGDYVANLVDVFRGVKRVLRDDGVLWVNLGDTYAGGGMGGGSGINRGRDCDVPSSRETPGIQQKELIGIPWMFAFAMRADGWLLRQELIWAKAISFGDRHADQVRERVWAEAKRLGLSDASAAALAACVAPQIGACMPQSCEDRCTTSHEQLFMFTKRPDYFADMESVKESAGEYGYRERGAGGKYQSGGTGLSPHCRLKDQDFSEKGRNLRSVWTINPAEPLMQLRADLTPEQRARAIQVLTERGML